MSKYWLTVRHHRPKTPSDLHYWRHTLRYGRNVIGFWTISELSPNTLVQNSYAHNGVVETVQIFINGNRNTIIGVYDL